MHGIMAIFLYTSQFPVCVDSLSEEDLSVFLWFAQKQELPSGFNREITPKGSPVIFKLRTIIDSNNPVIDTIGEVVETYAGQSVSVAGLRPEGSPFWVETEMQTKRHDVNKDAPLFVLTKSLTDGEGNERILVYAIVRYAPSSVG